MARGGGRLQQPRAAAAPARRGRGPLGLLCLALLCSLGAAEAEFSILDEAQVLASQMRKLATEELRVVTMQVKLRETKTEGRKLRTTVNLTSLLALGHQLPVSISSTTLPSVFHAGDSHRVKKEPKLFPLA